MKNLCVKIRNRLDLDIQVIKNICLYCMGDFYLNQERIECRFEKEDQRDEFLANLYDLDIKPINDN